MQTNLLQPVFEEEEKEKEKISAPSFSQISTRQLSLDTDFDTQLLNHISCFIADEKADPEEKQHKGEPEVYAQLATVSQRFYSLFKIKADAERDRRLKELCEHIVRGHPDQVTAILDEKPSLLLSSDPVAVEDCAGYTIIGTPYRAALASDDPQMAEIVQKYLIEFAGKEQALAQWNAQFPHGWEEAERIRWLPLFGQLEVLDSAIRESAVNDITSSQGYRLTVREGSRIAEEHARFMLLLKATQNESIQTGRAFNRHFMQAVANLYDTYVDDFRDQDPKRLFCWQRVFGGTQCFVPAADAASFVDWLDTKKLKNNEPQNRSMKMEAWDHAVRGWVDSSFFPADGSSRLGVDYAVLGVRRSCVWLGRWAGSGARGAGRSCSGRLSGFVARFLSVKNSCFSKIYAAICAPRSMP